MDKYISLCILYLVIGIFFVIKDSKYLRQKYVIINPNSSPFWQGFAFGLYLAATAMLFPIHIFDKCYEK